jgi:sugar phosphate isomerase/epimerase
MTKHIALQLYTLRGIMPKDYEGILRKVAAAGYDGVETAGFDGTTPEKAGKLFKELHLTACSAHIAPPVGDKKNEVIETMEAINCKTIVNTQIGPDDVKTPDLVKKTVERLNAAYLACKGNGISMGIHNHWWEYTQMDFGYPYEIMKATLDPAIFFELDTYWIKVGGVDPAVAVKEFGARAPYLHIKDGPAVKGKPMTAVGDGVMDVKGLLAAAGANAKWLVVEMDEVATDPIEAVVKSCKYLRGL